MKNSSICRRYCVAAIVVGFAVGELHAEPEGLRLDPAGNGRLFPALEVAGYYTDNFYAQRDDEVDVSGVLIRPALYLEERGNRALFQMGGRAEIASFDDKARDKDNYTDGTVFGHLSYSGGRRHDFRLNAARDYRHDPFGQVRTEGSPLADRKLDEFHQDRAELGYRFGAVGALINFDYQIDGYSKEYDTNREQGTRFLDHDRYGHQASFFYNYSPKTSAVLRLQQRKSEFGETQAGFAPRDAEERGVLVGAEWKATAKTSGRVLFGYFKREPDSDLRDDTERADWDVEINWSPRVWATFALRAQRTTDESYLSNAGVIDTETYAVAWKHIWSRRFSTELELSMRDQAFSDIQRKDELARVDLDAIYLLTDKLSIVLDAQYWGRDSNERARQFDRQVYTLGIRWAY